MVSGTAREHQFDLGPGFKVKYVFSLQNPMVLAYWMLLWGRLCLSALIVHEKALSLAEPRFSKPMGLTREDLLRVQKFST